MRSLALLLTSIVACAPLEEARVLALDPLPFTPPEQHYLLTNLSDHPIYSFAPFDFRGVVERMGPDGRWRWMPSAYPGTPSCGLAEESTQLLPGDSVTLLGPPLVSHLPPGQYRFRAAGRFERLGRFEHIFATYRFEVEANDASVLIDLLQLPEVERCNLLHRGYELLLLRTHPEEMAELLEEAPASHREAILWAMSWLPDLALHFDSLIADPTEPLGHQAALHLIRNHLWTIGSEDWIGAMHRLIDTLQDPTVEVIEALEVGSYVWPAGVLDRMIEIRLTTEDDAIARAAESAIEYVCFSEQRERAPEIALRLRIGAGEALAPERLHDLASMIEGDVRLGRPFGSGLFGGLHGSPRCEALRAEIEDLR